MIQQQLGKYQIVTPLGEGATAFVYHACDWQLQREVALKRGHHCTATPYGVAQHPQNGVKGGVRNDSATEGSAESWGGNPPLALFPEGVVF